MLGLKKKTTVAFYDFSFVCVCVLILVYFCPEDDRGNFS